MVEVYAYFLLGSIDLSPEAFVLQRDLELIQSDMHYPSIGEMQHILDVPHTWPKIRPFYLIKSRVPPFLLIARTDLPIPADDDHMRPLNGHLIDVLMIERKHLRLSC